MAVSVKPRLPFGKFSKTKADHALGFISYLKHTKGRWAGMPFRLAPWERKIVKEVFGTIKPNGFRLYQDVYIEIPKKNGKSEFGGALALYLLCADGEFAAEVYGAAADRGQATIVYDVAKSMVEQKPELEARCIITDSVKNIADPETNSFYRVLSSESYSKHGFNVSGLIVDELHAHPTRELYDVLTKGTGAARSQPLRIVITTAGTSRESICWELHEKARQHLNGNVVDERFYPVIFGLDEGEDWESEANWKRVNPGLGTILDIDDMRHDYQEAKRNPADEYLFRQLRLCQWVKAQAKRWMYMEEWDPCGKMPIDLEELKGRVCYAGVDLSSKIDLTAAAFVFPRDEGFYDILVHFWVPHDTMELRSRRDHVDYQKWVHQGFITATEGNVIDYDVVKKYIEDFGAEYDIKEIAFDSWNATQFAQDMQNRGFIMVEERQGYRTMSEPTKELMRLTLQRKIRHGGNPVLRWNMDNVRMREDPNANVMPDKEKSGQKIDGVVALIMALDRATRHANDNGPSIYETQDVKAF